ncbi:Lactonohydrolase oryL [Psilocybe cubensis]|uniref:Lactonohydrolase oryL n=2 Tax=Psilocybe cubensis TaxID=181762 RepID=A0ACB8GK19_PSICU|nr:Lactonohydrolase oryL [Psilocybe cubensis]KAH9475556.1 Lactonohydrolase oryL [Psilocybe cubensis]
MVYYSALQALAVSVYILNVEATQPNASNIPSEAVSIPPLSFAVMGQNATFRENGFKTTFNPTNGTPPFFQIFHSDFLDILGPKATVRTIAVNDTFASGFAFEAPFFNAPTNEIFFASSVFVPESSFNHTNRISKINMTLVEEALAEDVANINIPFTTLSLPDTIQIINGATGPFKGSFVLATRGRGNLPSSLVSLNPNPPNNATVLLDNFFGRQFNSMNDLKLHPSGNIFFTDDDLGFILDQKPPPLLPSQVYMFDPVTGLVRMVADNVVLPNGIAFSPDGKTGYIGDSAGVTNQTLPSTVYAYDVDSKTFQFSNRRVFAFIDCGGPDGIQVDSKGNLYVASGDGVQIFRKDGVLLGKIFIGSDVANMAFAGDGKLIILGNTRIFLAQINAKSGLTMI